MGTSHVYMPSFCFFCFFFLLFCEKGSSWIGGVFIRLFLLLRTGKGRRKEGLLAIEIIFLSSWILLVGGG